MAKTLEDLQMELEKLQAEDAILQEHLNPLLERRRSLYDRIEKLNRRLIRERSKSVTDKDLDEDPVLLKQLFDDTWNDGLGDAQASARLAKWTSSHSSCILEASTYQADDDGEVTNPAFRLSISKDLTDKELAKAATGVARVARAVMGVTGEPSFSFEVVDSTDESYNPVKLECTDAKNAVLYQDSPYSSLGFRQEGSVLMLLKIIRTRFPGY